MASSSSTDVRGPDGQLSVIAIGPVLKVWIDKVKDSTLVWVQTDGEYPGYPSKEWKTTTWWYARAKRGWIDDVGTQNMQWIEDIRGEFWMIRSVAREEANAEQTVRKRQYEQFSIEMNTTMKRYRTVSISETMTEQLPDVAMPGGNEVVTNARLDQLRRQHAPDHYIGTHDDDGNRFPEQLGPAGPWINSGTPEQAHEVQQDPWAHLTAPAQEGPTV